MKEMLKDVNVIIWDGHWSRQDALDNTDKLFLFGGNVLQDLLQEDPKIPTITQAVIRNLTNAVPIYTKLTQGKLEGAYFNDDLVSMFEALLNISASLIASFTLATKVIVIPSRENGIGTGTAYLQQKAPKCWELLEQFLAPFYERAEQTTNI